MSTAPECPGKVTDDHIEATVIKSPTEKPADATHWLTRAGPSPWGCPGPR